MTPNTLPRTALLERNTIETRIQCTISLDGSGNYQIDTGLGFLDHMLETLSKHSKIDIEIIARGDTSRDDHHTVEDVAIVLGEAIRQAIGEACGIERFGEATIAMDEALARAVLDISGRPAPVISLDLQREQIGGIACENITHFFRSFATELRCALHIDVLRGDNDHHRIEAAFKALARALRTAVSITGTSIPSTKGVLYE